MWGQLFLPNVAVMTVTQPVQTTSPPNHPRVGVRSLIRSRPVTSFFLFTLALSWWPWPLYAAGHPQYPWPASVLSWRRWWSSPSLKVEAASGR